MGLRDQRVIKYLGLTYKNFDERLRDSKQYRVSVLLTSIMMMVICPLTVIYGWQFYLHDKAYLPVGAEIVILTILIGFTVMIGGAIYGIFKSIKSFKK